jgi:hypothetical protein
VRKLVIGDSNLLLEKLNILENNIQVKILMDGIVKRMEMEELSCKQ